MTVLGTVQTYLKQIGVVLHNYFYKFYNSHIAGCSAPAHSMYLN